jgi:hypothetical protein
MIPFFKSKKIIYSRKLIPGELVRIFTHQGRRYVRIQFTNRVKFKGSIPTTDIYYSDITGVRKMPSPFKVWRCKLVGRKARATYYSFKKK